MLFRVTTITLASIFHVSEADNKLRELFHARLARTTNLGHRPVFLPVPPVIFHRDNAGAAIRQLLESTVPAAGSEPLAGLARFSAAARHPGRFMYGLASCDYGVIVEKRPERDGCSRV
jgi:hypothetical protein